MNTTKSKDGTTLAYDVYGDGPVLIYITGAICFRKFNPIIKDAKAFAKEFKVYTYDRRGRGDSGDNHPYIIDRELEDIEAIIDAAAGGSAFLYGHSSGAVLALEAALRFPHKVSKVLMFDAPYVDSEIAKSKYAILMREVVGFIHQGKNAQALRKFLIGIGMPKIFVYLLPLMPGWGAMKSLAPTLEYDMLLTCNFPPVERAVKLKVPLQVVYGGKSPVVIHEVAKQLVAAIPNAKLLQLPRQDHMVSAKILLPVLSSFFKWS